ncbi:hypothetical protein ABFY27_15375 [Akkermansia massiliensis]
MKPRITGEYRTSSSAILTIERSMLVNQLRSETNYGFQVNNSDKNDKLGWAAGIWMNGNGGTGTGTFNNRIEPAFNSRDNCFVTGTLSYDTSNDVFLKKAACGWITPITSPTGATTHKTRRMKSSPATASNPNTRAPAPRTW